MTDLIRCQVCHKVRTTETDYSPFLLIRGVADPGWWSTPEDGEICGPCMVESFRKANRL